MDNINPLYTRQTALDLHEPNSLTVVGCGGVGSWVAIFSAMSGIDNIYLFDHEQIEESNRNRLPFCEGSIGRNKVDVVAEFIRAIRPSCNVVPVAGKLEGILVNIALAASGCLIECTDSPKSQKFLYRACKGTSMSFIRAGYDGTSITATSNVSGWIKDEEQEDYTVAPSWVVPAATIAALAVGKMMKYHNQEVNLDLSEIGTPILEKRKRFSPGCRDKLHQV